MSKISATRLIRKFKIDNFGNIIGRRSEPLKAPPMRKVVFGKDIYGADMTVLTSPGQIINPKKAAKRFHYE